MLSIAANIRRGRILHSNKDVLERISLNQGPEFFNYEVVSIPQ